MSILEFMSNSPFLSFFLAVFFVLPIMALPFKIINRLIRHMNIRAKGWPPAHLDADGDWKPEDAA